ncbi:hypothetical protein M501DRAFT_1016532 [Patellaria atrata CBS 101060]|uniref:Heterokaryon incompatibility domain-containing protein n=1 Tax=Patellaria atrata CBS 101060 TaxID=1346257 RepID=A0A9P4SCS1_9PEZI|nr:hypothetical protein M501DRAFT_1016532 [Patellaria atrata CBS 101060]
MAAGLPVYAGQIRLLSLHPGQWEDEISCDLLRVGLEEEVPYRVLSYASTDSNSKEIVHLNGSSVEVSKTLYQAFRRYRAAVDTPGYLWVDVLCMNTSDNFDLSYQTNLRRHIIAKAEETYAWLAEDDVLQTLQRTSMVKFYGDSRDNSEITDFRRVTSVSPSPDSAQSSCSKDALWRLFCVLRLLSSGQHFEDIPVLLKMWHSSTRTNVFLTLNNFTSQAWWYRPWTPLELVFSRKTLVMYGNVVAPWPLLSDAAKFFDAHKSSCCRYLALGNSGIVLDRFVDVLRPLQDIRKAVQDNPSKYNTLKTLPSLLWQFRHCRAAADDREKVFAFLGMIKDWHGHTPILADYTQTTAQVYRNLTITIFRRITSLSLLENDLRKYRNLGLPSWIPDWSDGPSNTFFQRTHDRTKRRTLFNASAGLKAALEVDRDELKVQGILVDEIETITSVLWPSEGVDWKPFPPKTVDPADRDDESMSTSGNSHRRSIPKAMAQVHSLLGSSGSSSHSQDRSRDNPRSSKHEYEPEALALWRTLCADSIAEAHFYPLTYSRLKSTDYEDLFLWADLRFTQNVLPTNLPEKFKADEVPYPNFRVRAIDKSYAAAAEDSKFFITRKGRMGLGPQDIQSGDCIAILAGARMPFAIRKKTSRRRRFEDPDQYILLGACYVHGIMDGQAVSKSKKSQIYDLRFI